MVGSEVERPSCRGKMRRFTRQPQRLRIRPAAGSDESPNATTTAQPLERLEGSDLGGCPKACAPELMCEAFPPSSVESAAQTTNVSQARIDGVMKGEAGPENASEWRRSVR